VEMNRTVGYDRSSIVRACKGIKNGDIVQAVVKHPGSKIEIGDRGEVKEIWTRKNICIDKCQCRLVVLFKDKSLLTYVNYGGGEVRRLDG